MKSPTPMKAISKVSPVKKPQPQLKQRRSRAERVPALGKENASKLSENAEMSSFSQLQRPESCLASNLEDLTLSTIDNNKVLKEQMQVPASPSKRKVKAVSPAKNKFSAFGRTLKNEDHLLDSSRTQNSARKKKPRPTISVTSFDEGEEAKKLQ